MLIKTKNHRDYFVIADHLRTTIFALTDGARFEPKGRGYVLKKMIKKTTWLLYIHRINTSALRNINKKIVEVNSHYYPRLIDSCELVITQIETEVEKQLEFINRSIRKLNELYLPSNTAKDIFFWYDTEGIPIELIRHYLREKKHKYSETKLNELLEEQKKRSKSEWQSKKIRKF